MSPPEEISILADWRGVVAIAALTISLINSVWSITSGVLSNLSARRLRRNKAKSDEFKEKFRTPLDNCRATLRVHRRSLVALSSETSTQKIVAGTKALNRPIAETLSEISDVMTTANSNLLIDGQDWLACVEPHEDRIVNKLDALIGLNRTAKASAASALCREIVGVIDELLNAPEPLIYEYEKSLQ